MCPAPFLAALHSLQAPPLVLPSTLLSAGMHTSTSRAAHLHTRHNSSNCVILHAGAGILAVPAVTKDAGFVPSCAVLLGCYFFSAVTGLFITEVCSFACMSSRAVVGVHVAPATPPCPPAVLLISHSLIQVNINTVCELGSGAVSLQVRTSECCPASSGFLSRLISPAHAGTQGTSSCLVPDLSDMGSGCSRW
jgi:hypothetical protein